MFVRYNILQSFNETNMRLSDVDITDLKNAINSGYLHVTFFYQR